MNSSRFLHKFKINRSLKLTFLFLMLFTGAYAQFPGCSGTPYVYLLSGSNIMFYNPALPISVSNPSNTGITCPGGALGVAGAIAGGTLSPTFWTVAGGNYQYWNGSSWVNTGHATGNSAAVNIGGCGSAIYNLVGGTGQVYAYYGTGPGSLLFTIPSFAGGGPYDLVVDGCCNIYCLNAVGAQMYMYSPTGVLTATYSLSGLPAVPSGGGFAILGNQVYVHNGSFHVGTISGSTISFTTAGTIPGPMDFANCYSFVSGAGGGSAVASTNGSITCTNSVATVVATTTASPVTYSWSGPGIVGATNLSSATATAAGVYSCIVSAGGCTAVVTTSVTSNNAPVTPTLSVTQTITCTNPTVAVSSLPGGSNYNYSWNGPGIVGANNTQNIVVNTQGSYSVTITNTATGCSGSDVISVTTLTTTPSISVTPISQTITCNGGCKTFTAISTTTTNIVGSWIDPGNNIVVGPSGTPLIICANAPGTYTCVFLNTVTGCTNSQTVSVASNVNVPTLTITPTTSNGFTINCTNPSVAMVINSSGTLAPTGYTWTNLSTSVSTTPATGGYTVTVPGQYEAAFHDGNFCTVTTTVTIYIDTIRPSPFSTTTLPSNSYTLTCFTPSLVATANTNPMMGAGSYSWTTPPNLILSSNTVTVSMVNITSSTSPTAYTVLAMGANGCVGRAKVNFYKDIYVPPYTVVFTPTAITCVNPCVALTGNNVSGTTTPVSYTFTSPPPTVTATTAGALMCTPGTYTMQYQNAINGCTSVATTSVPLNAVPPATVALAPITLPCGQTTTVISAGTTTTSTSYSYTWGGPPLSGMSCPGGVNCNTTSVNSPGAYSVTILNTVNGCVSINSVQVNAGTVIATFTANPPTGYAPLTVNFTPTQLGLTSGSLSTTWNYGNGISTTTVNSSLGGVAAGSTVYQSAGSYTVMMILTVMQGTATCVGTASAVVEVDLESELKIPNVFTPNGDGVNDFFILQTTNLTEITCVIYDRWGVKMYDVTADKGNISWDGKNFSNKDVPAGTYFYILSAKGKDEKAFEHKGTISLYR